MWMRGIMHADDVVLVGDLEAELQAMLDMVEICIKVEDEI